MSWDNNILEDMLCYSRFSLLYMPVVPQNPVSDEARDFLASLLRWIFLFSSCQSQGTIWIETIK